MLVAYQYMQTDDINLSTDERTQTEQLNSDAQVINIPTVLTKKRERSTQTRCTNISSSCWVFARYIFHVLVVYHQYLYQVYTLESDR
jgi:hypothetical protein